MNVAGVVVSSAVVASIVSGVIAVISNQWLEKKRALYTRSQKTQERRADIIMDLYRRFYDYRAALFALLHTAGSQTQQEKLNAQKRVDDIEVGLSHFYRLNRFLFPSDTCVLIDATIKHLHDAEGRVHGVHAAYEIGDLDKAKDSLMEWRRIRSELYPAFDTVIQKLDADLRRMFGVE